MLVRQYRHPVRDWTLEVPAGSVEEGESALEAAQRELLEEVGGTIVILASPLDVLLLERALSLRSDAFLASDVELAADRGRGREPRRRAMPLEEALARARGGGFVEGQTALAILLAAPFLEQRR